MGIFTQLCQKQYLLLAFMLLSSVLPTFAADDDLITEQVIACSPLEEDESIGSNKDKITNLTIFSELDDSDMKFLREMKHLEFLDLSGAYLLTTNLALDDAKELKQIILPYMEQTEWNNISFCNCSSLASFYLPEDVSQINNKAFSGCRSLTTFNIPWSVTNIGKEAFSNCSGLKSIYIPGEVSQISDETFSGCSSLTTIRLSKWVTNINSKAFEGCKSLKSIYCHSNILADPTAFDGVDKEKCIVYVPTGLADTYRKNDAWKAFKNIVEYDADADEVSIYRENLAEVIGNKKDKIVSLSFVGYLYENDLECIREMKDHLQFLNLRDAQIVDSHNWQNLDLNFKDLKKLQQIALPTGSSVNNRNMTFTNCSSLTSITIPGVYKLAKEAFSGCNSLISANIIEQTQIADKAFSGCSSLISANISGATQIGDKAFSGCSNLKFVSMGNVEQLGNEAFCNCSSLKFFEIPHSITQIKDGTFSGCSSLTSISMQEHWKVTQIGNKAFNGCSSLKSVLIPKGVTTIGDKAFSGCSRLTSINIPEKVTQIGNGAFQGCRNLTSVNIPAKVTQIGNETFDGCSSLTSMRFPYGLKSISQKAFSGCQNMESIYCQKDVLAASTAFDGVNKEKCIVYVPKGSVYTYKNKETWKMFKNIVEHDYSEDLVTIDLGAYSSLKEAIGYRGKIKKLKVIGYLSDSDVSFIHYKYFHFLDISQTFEDSLTCDLSFDDNPYVEQIVLPEWSSITHYMFRNCSSLKSVNIPVGTRQISYRAFDGCWSLESIFIPSSVTEIYYDAFRYCSSLDYVYCNRSTPPTLGSDVFYLEDHKSHDTLYVPIGSAEAYRKAGGWNFSRIVEYDFNKLTGIDKVTTDSDNQGEAHEIARYSINGQRLNAPTQGLNIVKYSDGTTKKVMVP